MTADPRPTLGGEPADRGSQLAQLRFIYEIARLATTAKTWDELLGAVVPSATGLRTARRISHVFVMNVPSYPKLLLITDVAVNIYPKLKEKEIGRAHV